VIEISDSVREWFLESGWQPGRDVNVPGFVPRVHPAWDILNSYGGLTLLERNPDPDFDAIEEFEFGAFPPETSALLPWMTLLKSQLVKIAKVHNNHAELYMDEEGRCYGNSLMHDAFWFSGVSFGDMLEGTLANRRHRPMLRPDQSAVWLYGEKITPDDPTVYDYRSNQ
jgi:hypothetical protein